MAVPCARPTPQGPGAAGGLPGRFDLKDETTTGEVGPGWPRRSPRVRSWEASVLTHISRALNKDLESIGDLLAFVCSIIDV